jgi:hypothetical protein
LQLQAAAALRPEAMPQHRNVRPLHEMSRVIEGKRVSMSQFISQDAFKQSACQYKSSLFSHS